ncbi:MAG: phosphatase PAP2 family protein [Clostridiaceae bacterium]|nr:phosphatase PAP2 family protein [Clostridiaceae bacterium]
MVDYRNFRLSKLNTPEYSHLKLLFFWPLYGLVFLILERGCGQNFHLVYTALDDKIPFCELFAIPYYFWFLFLIGMLLYTLLFDVQEFRRYMWTIILTYSITCVIYIVYPTYQNLRPAILPRDNFLTRIISGLYAFDTNTNVCPSLHVTGSLAVYFASLHIKRFQTLPWRLAFAITTVLICASTVFLKQHSLIDVAAALVLCALVYPMVYRRHGRMPDHMPVS